MRVVAVALLALACFASGASAAQRFVVPDGSVLSFCTDAEPCALQRAVELANATHGDELIIAPGTYDPGSAELDATGDDSGTLSIHGVRGLPRPRLTGEGALVLATGRAHVSHLEIDGVGTALSVGAGGVYEDLAVTTESAQSALLITDPADGATPAARVANTIAHAVSAGRAITSIRANLDLRHVTAIAGDPIGNGTGVAIEAGPSGVPITVTLLNSIARAAGANDDVRACTGGQPLTVTFRNSAYADAFDACDPGTPTFSELGGKIASAPALDAWLHQLAGSPTIDAGYSLAFEPFDVDLQARPFGAAPDVGADEYLSGSGPATAFTEHVTGLTQDGVTLHGALNPGGGSVTYRFAYGRSADLAGAVRTPERQADGVDAVPAVEQLSGLPPATYHYRLEVTKAGATVTGDTRTFAFPTRAPVATTGTADVLGPTAVVLHGDVTPNGETTDASFEFGTTSGYGLEAAVSQVGPFDPAQVTATVSGLQPGTTLHYRLKTSNARGVGFGEDRTVVLPQPASAPGGVAADRSAPLLIATLGPKVDRRGRLTVSFATDDASAPVKVEIVLRNRSGVVGRRTLTARLGAAQTVRIRLDRQARRRLRSRRRLAITLTITASDAAGNVAQRTRRHTLRR